MNNKASTTLDICFDDLTAQERYKILCGVVIPRPIAWVSTISTKGVVNVAPFSFFNVFSEDPPLVVLGLQHHADGSFKDTTKNIHDTGEFVINLCDESMAELMNDTSVDFPSDVSEADAVSLSLNDSTDIVAPRLVDAPFALECRREVSLAFGPGRELLVGRPIRVHAKAGLLDPESWYVNYNAYAPVGRLFADLYARQSDIFSLQRESHSAYEERKAKVET